jgi:hypothetical protein
VITIAEDVLPTSKTSVDMPSCHCSTVSCPPARTHQFRWWHSLRSRPYCALSPLFNFHLSSPLSPFSFFLSFSPSFVLSFSATPPLILDSNYNYSSPSSLRTYSTSYSASNTRSPSPHYFCHTAGSLTFKRHRAIILHPSLVYSRQFPGKFCPKA